MEETLTKTKIRKIRIHVVAIISIILIYILPLSAVNNHGAACTYGMAANFVYLYSIILIIYWIILLFKNIKNILNKKYYIFVIRLYYKDNYSLKEFISSLRDRKSQR